MFTTRADGPAPWLHRGTTRCAEACGTGHKWVCRYGWCSATSGGTFCSVPLIAGSDFDGTAMHASTLDGARSQKLSSPACPRLACNAAGGQKTGATGMCLEELRAAELGVMVPGSCSAIGRDLARRDSTQCDGMRLDSTRYTNTATIGKQNFQAGWCRGSISPPTTCGQMWP